MHAQLENLAAFVTTLVVLLTGAAVGQGLETPKERCPFQGFATTFQLAVITRSTDGWVLCPPNGGCRSSPLKANEPIVVYNVDGAWTCAALPGGPGWVRSTDTRAITADPSPRLDMWAGNRSGGAGRITIRRAKTFGALRMSGRGRWEGGNGLVHTGTFTGHAAPQGNRMRFSDGFCEIDLLLAGRYILAEDNGGCGGLNVSFSGIWTRVAAPSRK